MKTANVSICICSLIRSAICAFPVLAAKVEYAQFLHDGSEVRFTDGTDCFFLTDDPEAAKDLVFYVPNVKPHTLVPVIEIFLKD